MSRRAGTWLLAVGAAAGAALGAWRVVDVSDEQATALPPDVVAVVDGRPIRRDDYERALAAVEAEREAPLDAQARRRVLDRLVDEELLVQRGLELGLAGRDERLRAQLSSSVIALLTARAEEKVADADEQRLRRFYRSHPDRFRRTPRVRIEHLFFRVEGKADDAHVRARAREVRAGLERDRGVEGLRDRADRYDVPVPGGWMPLSELRATLGPTVARTVAALEPGETSEPVRSGSGYHVVRLEDRRGGKVAPFDEVRAEVRYELRRDAGERALRRFLERRREHAEIRIREAKL